MSAAGKPHSASTADEAAIFDYDLKGLKCPLPVLRSRKKLEVLAAGCLMRIETTDPLAVIDIPHFCREDGHTLEATEQVGGGHRFLIRKKV